MSNEAKPGTVGCNCPSCGAEPKDQIVKNYDPLWRDGEVFCKICDSKVRDYDAG